MSNQIVEDLRQARQLIEKKENWHGGDNPLILGVRDNRKCAAHAISGVAGTDNWLKHRQFLVDHFPENYKGTTLSGFNDSHSHAQVLDLFDRAIQAADEAIALAMETVPV